MHGKFLTSVYFQFSSRNFSWGLCLLVKCSAWMGFTSRSYCCQCWVL